MLIYSFGSKFIYIKAISWRQVINIVQQIVNKWIDVNAKDENEEMLLHLICRNNHDGVVSMLFIVFNLLFIFPNFCFKIYKSWIVQNCVISYNHPNIMWELYVQRERLII
jgi:type II secretory pathway component PulC